LLNNIPKIIIDDYMSIPVNIMLLKSNNI